MLSPMCPLILARAQIGAFGIIFHQIRKITSAPAIWRHRSANHEVPRDQLGSSTTFKIAQIENQASRQMRNSISDLISPWQSRSIMYRNENYTRFKFVNGLGPPYTKTQSPKTAQSIELYTPNPFLHVPPFQAPSHVFNATDRPLKIIHASLHILDSTLQNVNLVLELRR